MRLKIEIEIDEQKDGVFLTKLGDKVLGDAGSVNPEEELDRVYMLIKAKEILPKIDLLRDKMPEMQKELNNSIRENLAKLLAYFSIEER